MKVAVSQLSFRNTAQPLNCNTQIPLSDLMHNIIVSRRTYEGNEKARYRSVPSSVRLQLGVVWEFGAIQTLRLGTSVETDVCHRNAEPGHQTSNSSQVGEPAEDLARTGADTHECKERECGRAYKSSPRQAVTSRALEKSRRVLRNCQTIYMTVVRKQELGRIIRTNIGRVSLCTCHWRRLTTQKLGDKHL